MRQREPYVFIGGTSEPGGLHVHTADVAAAVCAAGHRVHVLCPSVDHFTALCAPMKIGVTVLPSRNPREPALYYWLKHLAPFRGMRAVYCRGHLAEGPVTDLLGIRLITSRLYTVEHRPLPEARRRSPTMLRLHGRAMRLLVDKAVTVSDQVAHHAVGILGLPKAMVATCLNWVDPLFRGATDEQRREAKLRLGISPDGFVIGYHGRLAPEKRLPVLVEGLARLEGSIRRPYLAVLLGEGWKRRELEELVSLRGLTDRIVFRGWQPDPSQAICAFDCAVLPSFAEGFPLGLMESMATGSVCLAHPISSTMRLIRSGVNGFLSDLAEPDKLAEALRNILELDQSIIKQISSSAALTIAAEFSRRRRLPDVLRALGIRDAEQAVAGLAPIPRNLVFARAAS